VLEDNLKTVSCCAFPQQLEQDIIFSVVAGNRQMLEDALISLNELNIQVLQEGTISSRLLWEQLAAVIAMALSRVRNIPEALQLKIILSLRRLINTDKCADFTRRIMNIMDPVFILAKQDQGTTSSRSQLTHEIIEYIQANLNNPDLCLQMISDHFSFSGAYISALVKEETGQGFAVYCERLRIANACEMLKNNAKIQDVAEAVGYNSVHSFRRAFKKVLGILPSQYPQL
jgi:YesN/AraC family two-component response regulator